MGSPFEIGTGLFRVDGSASCCSNSSTGVSSPLREHAKSDQLCYRTVLVVYLRWVNEVVYQVPLSYVVPLTLAITTLGALYQLILTLDAYRIKNNIQICVQCICNIFFSIATVMQYGQIKDANARILTGYDMYQTPFAKNDWRFWEHVSPALFVCLVVSCVSSVMMCGLAYALCREFSWTLYEQISPDRRIIKRYLSYQVSRNPNHV